MGLYQSAVKLCSILIDRLIFYNCSKQIKTSFHKEHLLRRSFRIRHVYLTYTKAVSESALYNGQVFHHSKDSKTEDFALCQHDKLHAFGHALLCCVVTTTSTILLQDLNKFISSPTRSTIISISKSITLQSLMFSSMSDCFMMAV